MLNKSLINYILQILWIIALVLGTSIAVYLVIELYKNENFIKDNSSLLAAFFILLSASIASASIMKSIEANRELKEKEVVSQNRAMLTFILHTCFELSHRLSRIVEHQFESDKIRHKEFYNIKDSVRSSIVFWKKLYEEEYFIFLNKDGYIYFHRINILMGELETLLIEISEQDKGNFTITPSILQSTTSDVIDDLNKFILSLADERKKLNITLYKEEKISIK